MQQCTRTHTIYSISGYLHVSTSALWMWSNRFQLDGNTEVLWCVSSRHQHQIPRTLVWVCSKWTLLKSASTSTLIVPLMHHSTIGNRTFPLAASCIWNSLSFSVTSSTSPTAIRRHLKSELFLQCFGPDCVWQFCSAFLVLCIMLNPERVFFIVKCSCSPRILWHLNHIRS